MKNIIINEKNAARIKSVLNEVQSRSKVRTIDIWSFYRSIEDFFETVTVQKSILDGVQVAINFHAQKFPNAYKYVPYGTVFTIEFRSGKMYLVDVKRDVVNAHKFWFKFPSGEAADRVYYDSFQNRVACDKSYQKIFDKDKIAESLNASNIID